MTDDNRTHGDADEVKTESPAEAEHAAEAQEEKNPEPAAEVAPAPVRKKKIRWGRVAALCAALLLFAAAGLGGGYFIWGLEDKTGDPADSGVPETTEDMPDETPEPDGEPDVDPGVDAILNGDRVDEATSALAGEDGGSAAGELVGEESLDSQSDFGADVQVVVYDGGSISADVVLEVYDELLSQYRFAGITMDGSEILDEAMETLAQEAVTHQNAEKMGLTELDDEQNAAIDDKAREMFDDLPADSGITYESIRAAIAEDWWKTRLYRAVTESVRVDDSDVEREYRSLMEEQEALFTDNSDEYEMAVLMGDLVVYHLPGYRSIDYVLVPFTEENAGKASILFDRIASLDPTADAEEIAGYQAELDALFDGISQAADDVMRGVAAAADADQAIRGATGAGIESENVFINGQSNYLCREFIDACMALSAPGDHTDLIRTADGYVIACYAEDVKAGKVELTDELSAAIQARLLDEACDTVYQAALDEWMGEANVAYYPERMQ